MNKTYLLSFALSSILFVSAEAIQPLAKVEGPEIHLDIGNGTINDYTLNSEDGIKIADIPKAVRTKKIDLKSLWTKPYATTSSKLMELNVKDTMGKTKLVVMINASDEFASVSLRGASNDMQALNFEPEQKNSFLINLGLKGDNLENSDVEITAIQH